MYLFNLPHDEVLESLELLCLRERVSCASGRPPSHFVVKGDHSWAVEAMVSVGENAWLSADCFF